MPHIYIYIYIYIIQSFEGHNLLNGEVMYDTLLHASVVVDEEEASLNSERVTNFSYPNLLSLVIAN